MNAARRVLLFPHPVISLVLLVVWLVLQRSLAPGHFLLGAVLAVLVPLFTHRFWPETVPIARPSRIPRFLAVVLWDIAVANFSVARLALAPTSALRPGFARLPLDVDNDFALTVLASTVSLTPGTVSAEVTADRAYLVIHYLACDDEAELLRSVKTRYETPIKEIFGC